MTLLEIELLEKSIIKDVRVIYTHFGFTNNCNLSNGEKELLNTLAIKMDEMDEAAIVSDKVLTPFFSGWDGGTVLSGIKISSIIK